MTALAWPIAIVLVALLAWDMWRRWLAVRSQDLRAELQAQGKVVDALTVDAGRVDALAGQVDEVKAEIKAMKNRDAMRRVGLSR